MLPRLSYSFEHALHEACEDLATTRVDLTAAEHQLVTFQVQGLILEEFWEARANELELMREEYAVLEASAIATEADRVAAESQVEVAELTRLQLVEVVKAMMGRLTIQEQYVCFRLDHF